MKRADIVDIYIMPEKNAIVKGGDNIRIKDVCGTAAPNDIKKRIEQLTLIKAGGQRKEMFLISCVDIINIINAEIPGHTVHCVGESETIIEYWRENKKPSAVWNWIKVTAICLISIVY